MKPSKHPWVAAFLLCALLSGLQTEWVGAMSFAGPEPRRVVYLVDASGSMMDTYPFVIYEVRRSINTLKENQLATVIFFQDDPRSSRARPRGSEPEALRRVKPVVPCYVP